MLVYMREGINQMDCYFVLQNGEYVGIEDGSVLPGNTENMNPVPVETLRTTDFLELFVESWVDSQERKWVNGSLLTRLDLLANLRTEWYVYATEKLAPSFTARQVRFRTRLERLFI